MKINTFCLLVNLFFVSISMFSQNEFLDQTFGTNGIIIQNYTDIPSGQNLESDFKTILQLPDGSFLTASNFHLHGNDPRYIINRYDKNGVLDLTFGEDGFVSGGLWNFIGGIELQSDGKITGFATGLYINPDYSHLFRYNADGSLDISFGNNGTVSDPLNDIKSISVQADDKILVAKTPRSGRAIAGFTIERYKPDGLADSDFGNNGVIDFSLSQENITIHDVISQDNGKILISGNYGGSIPDDYQRDIFFMRLNNDGSLDTTFGVGGVRNFNFNDVDDTENVMVQSDGKVVFSSFSYGLLPGTSIEKRLIRLTTDGNLDGAFGTGGIKRIEYPILGLQSLKELPNGKLIAAGTYETSVDPGPGNNEEPVALVMVRYDINGNLDADFGDNGYITTTLTNSRALNDKISIQPDGKILAGATFCEAWMSCHPHTVVLRYNPTGRLTASEFNENNDFLLYPNPFRETITVDFTLNQPEVLSMDLYSYDGRKVTTLLKKQNFQSGFNSQQLDFPGSLASGIYFLTVSGESETKNFRIVKK